jgi:hypothetical protein
MRRSPHRITSVLLAGCLGASSAFSYDTELSSTAVREAYFLGQRHGKDTRDFLAPYSRHLPLPKSGPYISGIRLLTPFAPVVEFSNQQSLGYSAQQAWLDYRARGDSIVLEMHIEFTPTYNQFDAQHSSIHAARRGGITLRTEDFLAGFSFHHQTKRRLDRAPLSSRCTRVRKVG